MLEENNTGIPVNGPRIIDGLSKSVPGTFPKVIEGSYNGAVAAVVGPDKTIFDTGYIKKNELVGVHHLDVTWFSSLTGIGGYGLIFEYWEKDEDGNESLSQPPIEIPWHDDISDEFGNSAGEGVFHRNKQYRFVIKSHSSLADTDWVGLDFVRIIFEDHWKPGLITVYASPNKNPINLGFDALRVGVTNPNATNSCTVEVSMPYDCSNCIITTGVESAGFMATITAKTISTGNGFRLTVENKTATTTWQNQTVYVGIVLALLSYSGMV